MRQFSANRSDAKAWLKEVLKTGKDEQRNLRTSERKKKHGK